MNSTSLLFAVLCGVVALAALVEAQCGCPAVSSVHSVLVILLSFKHIRNVASSATNNIKLSIIEDNYFIGSIWRKTSNRSIMKDKNNNLGIQ